MKLLSRPSRIALAFAAVLALPGAARAGDLSVDGTLVSTAPAGAPLAVSSTTVAPHLNAGRLDGLDAADFARSLGNVVTVALSGGDFDDLGEALFSIVDASASNPYLVTVGPGTFGCGPCNLKPHVHVVGAGPSVSRISNSTSTAMSVVGPGPSSLRRLGFATESSSVTSTAIRVSEGASLQADEIDVSVLGGSVQTRGIYALSGALGLELWRSRIHVEGPKSAVAIQVEDCPARLRDVRIRVVRPPVGDPLSSNVGVSVGSGAEVEAAELAVVVSGGGEMDAGVESFGALVLRDSTLDVSGFPKTNVTGVRVGGGPAELSRVRIEVDGGEGGDLGGAEGVVAGGSTVTTLQECVVQAKGAEDVPLFVAASGDARVHHSRLSAAGVDISVATGGTARVAHSHLEGASTDPDTVCRFTTDEDLVTYTSTCP